MSACVKASKLGDGLLNHRGHLMLVGNVTTDGERLVTCGNELFGR